VTDAPPTAGDADLDLILSAARLEGDPVPDALVAEIFQRGEVDRVNRLLRGFERNTQAVPSALPDDLDRWFATSGRLPDEADQVRIDRASALFVEHGLQMALLMSTASLVWCYAASRGVKALMYTHRLEHDPYHRAAETSQFVLSVLAPGGLGEGGTGLRAVQKIRLIHASVRDTIRRSGTWDEATLGVPLCQEDLVLALLTFSSDVVDGLAVLGVELTPQDADDFLHAWAVIGRLLGIRAELIPGSLAEARALKQAIVRRQYGPTSEGVTLTRALLEMHSRFMPGEAFDGVVPAVLRMVVGPEVADWMAIPRGHWDGVIRRSRRLSRYVDVIDRRSGPLGVLANEVAYRFLTRLSIEATGYQRAGFEIPADLEAAWSARRAEGTLVWPDGQPEPGGAA
jgi:ER-bound oxygenase mpaB/B'/Rubber oxygenase, catalytic domain